VLQWLANQVSQLWAYVRSLAAQIAATANKLLTDLIARIESAYNRAVAWADREISLLGKAFDDALSWVLAQIQQARDYLNARIGEILGWAKGLWAQIEAWLVGRLDVVEAWLSDQIKWISGTFYSAVADVRGWIDSILGEYVWPVWKWFDYWKRRLAIFTDDALEMLHDFISRLYLFLYHLVDDPVGVLAGILSSFLLDFIGELLASALGSEKYELGPPRIFGKYSSPRIPGGGEPPAGAGGLVAPLSSLWIDGGNTFREGHPGLDLQLEVGQEVYAMHDGVAGLHAFDADGYGNWVTISGSPWWSLYAHLSDVAVGDGQRVYQGQVIGYGGSTGNSTGPHLHLELKYNGQYVDPAMVLPIG